MKIENCGRTVTYRGKVFSVGESVSLQIPSTYFLPLYYSIRKFIPTSHYSGRILSHVELEVSQFKDGSVGKIVTCKMSAIKKIEKTIHTGNSKNKSS